MKAAIVAARREALGPANDGKTLSPVLPRLLARHCKGTPGGRGGCGGNGHRKPFAAGGDKSAAAKRCGRKRASGGKEKVGSQNAGARAPAAAAASAGKAAKAAGGP